MSILFSENWCCPSSLLAENAVRGLSLLFLALIGAGIWNLARMPGHNGCFLLLKTTWDFDHSPSNASRWETELNIPLKDNALIDATPSAKNHVNNLKSSVEKDDDQEGKAKITTFLLIKYKRILQFSFRQDYKNHFKMFTQSTNMNARAAVCESGRWKDILCDNQ